MTIPEVIDEENGIKVKGYTLEYVSEEIESKGGYAFNRETLIASDICTLHKTF